MIKSWLQSLRAPRTPQAWKALLERAQQEQWLAQEISSMMQGVLAIDQLKVRDIMIPRAQMITLRKEQSIKEALCTIGESKHSRFPVVGQHRDEFTGLILAKDLLNPIKNEHKDLTTLCRPIACVSEDKRISHLLKEFQVHHTHLAIVTDEFGAISGLVTLEDIIEQIVGDIEDEHFDEASQQQWIKSLDANTHLIQAQTPIESVNKTLDLSLPTDEFDTLGGLISHRMGAIPKTGQYIQVEGHLFSIENAGARKINWIKLQQLP